MIVDWITLLAAVTIVVLVVMLLVHRLQTKVPSPRSQKREQRRMALWVSLPLFGAVFAWHVYQDPASTSTLIYGVLLLTVAWPLLFGSPDRFSKSETIENYRADRQHCGQCEYDLTGNESGICPECGWQIPRELPAAPPVHWAAWWQQWRIDHLENARRTMWECMLYTVLFVGAAVVMVVLDNRPAAVILGLAALNIAVSTGRVIACNRRQWNGRDESPRGDRS